MTTTPTPDPLQKLTELNEERRLQSLPPLPVVAWMTKQTLDGKKKMPLGECSTNPRYPEVHKEWQWEPLVKLSDALTAIESARLAGQVDAWQPIETAPKDMAPRLYLVKGFCVQGFIDVTGVLCAQTEIAPHWRVMRGKPTHWKPLPPPPAITAKDAK
jgi:hypothetical protein